MARIVSALFVLFSAMAFAEPQNVGDALATLSEGSKASSAELMEAVRLVRQASKADDSRVLPALLACVQDDGIQSPVRAEALRAALALVTVDQGLYLIGALRSVTQEIKRTRGDAEPAKPNSYHAASSVVAVFMESVPLAARLPSEPFLSLLRDWAILDFTEWRWGWLGPKAVDTIASDHAGIAVRRQYLLEVVRSVPFFQPTGEAAKLLSDATIWKALRSMFNEGLKEESHFHYGAASILARVGDQEVLTSLKKCLEEGGTKSVLDTETIRHYIWQIEGQHPPRGLLALIRSLDHSNSDAREWAIERAVELNLPREEIRDALVAHCAEYKNPADKTWMAMRPRLISVATRTGVLKRDEIELLPAANEMPLSPYEHSHDARVRR